MAKSDNIFVRAAAYRKLHPRTSMPDAVKKMAKVGKTAKRKTVSSPVKRTVGKAKAKTAVRAKNVNVRVGSVNKSKSVNKVGQIGAIESARKLVNDIERLETKRLKERSKEMKDVIQLQINATHKKLDAIKKRLSA